jgi:DNA topoisomerase-1
LPGNREKFDTRSDCGKNSTRDVLPPDRSAGPHRRTVRSCQDLPGQLLFQWEGADGTLHPIGSSDVNEYLREHVGLGASAKTFRTWGASVHAAELLASEPPPSRRDANRVVDAAIDARAVCRRSYVHPAIVDAYLADELESSWSLPAPRRPAGLSTSERRFLRFVELGRRSRTRRSAA